MYQLNILRTIKTDYKKPMKNIKIFLRKKNKKSKNMVVKVTKISQKMENESLLSIDRNIIE